MQSQPTGRTEAGRNDSFACGLKTKVEKEHNQQAKTHIEASVSRFRHSTRKSLIRMLQMIFRLPIDFPPVAPHNTQIFERCDVQWAVITHPSCFQGDQTFRQGGALLEIMCRKKQSFPWSGNRRKRSSSFSLTGGPAREGLVEDHEVRIMQKGPGQGGALLQASREIACENILA